MPAGCVTPLIETDTGYVHDDSYLTFILDRGIPEVRFAPTGNYFRHIGRQRQASYAWRVSKLSETCFPEYLPSICIERAQSQEYEKHLNPLQIEAAYVPLQ